MDETEQGVIEHVIYAGTVTQVVIRMADGKLRWLVADSNMLNRAQEGIGKASLCGLSIEFAETDWSGGLAWFSVIEEGHIRCANCRRHIPQHLEPGECFFGQHRRKNLGNKNGAHRDE